MGNEKKTFFDRLFAGKIRWALHTAMTCDLAYVSALIKKQQGEQLQYNTDLNCAFFYDSKNCREPSAKIQSPRFDMRKIKAYTHGVSLDNGIHHAKLSLVCCEKNAEKDAGIDAENVGFRLAVYSKNLEFGGSIDAALLFDLEFKEGEKEVTPSGQQLCNYIGRLCSTADKEGQNWLKDNVNPYLEHLKKVSLKSEFGGLPAELYFGGLGDGTNLGELLALNTAANFSIVLTPPAFVGDISTKEFFSQKKKILYDHVSRPSHIKLYLLEKSENSPQEYELWVGSANATPNGLGWDFKNQEKLQKANIECLAKFNIDKEKFDILRESICKKYNNYTDFEVDGSLIVQPDVIGPYIVNNFKCTKMEYTNGNYNGEGKIKVTLEKNGSGQFPGVNDDTKVRWRPLEYSETNEDCCFGAFKENKVELEYEYKTFHNSQGILIFGSSCYMMMIRDALLQNQKVPMQKDKLVKDTRLTEWLLNRNGKKENIPDEPDEKWDQELRWIHKVLKGSTPSLFYNTENAGLANGMPVNRQGANFKAGLGDHGAWQGVDFNGDGKAQPMSFQKNGAERLFEILKEHPRAFLADEPGLGKTFTSAMLMNKLAENRQDKNPFYVIYVAPNLPLLKKNGEELARKCNDVLQDSKDGRRAVLLSDYVSPKERLKNAYSLYYDNKIKKEEDRKGKLQQDRINALKIEKNEILRKIDGEFDKEDHGNTNIRSYTKGFVKKIHNKKDDYPNAPYWNNGLLNYYDKEEVPDRLIFVHKVLQDIGQNELNNKIVIITVSEEVALRTDIKKGAEEQILERFLRESSEINKVITKNDRRNADFSAWFLEKYKPGLIIWDEYHRYMGKLKSDNPFFEKEKEGLKALFVSATPYKTNISGSENEKVFDELYDTNVRHRKGPKADLDDESPDIALPSFEDDFIPLFCGGSSDSELDEEKLKEAYNALLENKCRSALERLLKRRMIRNERTRLQGYYEEYISLTDPGSQYDDVHAEILNNTYMQCRRLKNAGYPEGALKWSLSMPWILSFSTSRTAIKTANGTSYFECLKPNRQELCEDLFVYNKDGKPKEEKLLGLPKQNLAMHQICRHNLPGKKAAQLLWMPATMPLYDVGDKSIFIECADYSKLLVFAEYRYLQRGGAILLSDYCRLLLKEGSVEIPGDFLPEIAYRNVAIIDLPNVNRNCTLDDLLKAMQCKDEDKLYQLASPEACAKRLKLNPRELTDAFNNYFQSAGVKEALWSWLCDNNYSDGRTKWEEGILRYCAEGNLYAVLKEWLFCMKEQDSGKRMEYIRSVLERTHSRVGVQTLSTTVGSLDGSGRICGFAEQLTGDIGDVGSGENEIARSNCCNAFNSPFYPMIMFVGKGAQEGLDMHNYCLRIMHLTLPRGAVSYEQRNGRIDRYRSLLVRRRAAELVESCNINDFTVAFKYLANKNNDCPANKLYPNWSIKNENSKWNFEELMPVWEYTEEYCFAKSVKEMLRVYRESMGVHNQSDNSHIDLSTQ